MKINENINIKFRITLLFTIVLMLPSLLIFRVLDNDIWFLLNSGRYVMNYGIPHIEPFTIHNNMQYVMQQWLSSIIFWLTFKYFGQKGIFILMISVFSLMVITMYKINNLISNKNIMISFTITMIFSVFISLTIKSRPIIFTLMIIIIELFILEKYKLSRTKRYLTLLPLLSLLLINLHSAMWPILFIILLPYIIDSLNFKIKFFALKGYDNKYLIIAIIFMVIVASLNPYGVESMTYLLRSYGYPEISNYVNEMKPPNINNAYGIFIYSLFFMVAIIYIICNGKSTLRYFLLTVGTGIMALSSVRNFPFFIICSLFPLTYYLKDIKINSTNISSSFKVIRLRNILILFIIILLFINLIAENNEYEDKELSNIKVMIDNLLKSEDASKIVMYTGYKEGSYVEYMGIASYIDPRAEVFVKKNNKKFDILKEYRDLQDGKLYYKNFLNKYNFTHVLVSNTDILYTYMVYENNYTMIMENDNYRLYKIKK